MDLTLQELFDRARLAGAWLTPAEGEVVFAASVRAAVQVGAAPLPARLVFSGDGRLAPGAGTDERRAYLAPELLGSDPPRPNEPRVQVFAAGALGYELFTGRPPPEAPKGPGPELTGPLGDLVRVAMAGDRRERFGDLQQLLDAVEVVQQRRPPADERALLGALHARALRWGQLPPDAAALRDVLRSAQASVAATNQRLDAFEARVAAGLASQRAEGAAALQRMGASVAQLERVALDAEKARKAAERDRDEAEDRLTLASIQKKPSLAGPVLLSALFGGVVAAFATVAALTVLRPEPPARAADAPVATTVAPVDAGADARAAIAGPAAGPAAVPGDAGAKVPAAAEAARPAVPPTGPTSAPAAAPAASAAPPPSPTPAPSPSHPPSPSGAGPGPAGAPASPVVVVTAPAGARPLPPAAPKDEAPAGAPTPRMAIAVARSQVSRGDKALEQGRLEDAIASYQAALGSVPDLPDAVRGLGTVYAAQGKDKQALVEYERYLQLAPNAADAAEIRSAAGELRARSKLGGDDN